jgi:exodeoxyribonuclease-1
MFVFYDTETTGINAVFDQILQFAAILTNEQFVEVERFEIRCQLLPWVVPSPIAMLVTKTSVSALTDKTLPTFFGMMSAIHKKLSAWSPATYIGYNSLAFDEQFLHRALWQTLHPPYITVTNENKRCDLLQMVRVASHFFPDSFVWPKNENGKVTLKLDRLAPSNGFNHENAHDALNDVEATIFLAKMLSERLPHLWSVLLGRSQKANAASIALSDKPVLLFENVKGKSSAWFGQNLERDQAGVPSRTLMAKLGYDWRGINSAGLEARIEEIQKNTRPLAFNKAPTVFTLKEAKDLFGLEPSAEEQNQSSFLNADKTACNAIVTIIKSNEKVWPVGKELEQKIYDGFPSKEDERLALNFHNTEWPDRAKIVSQFGESKYRQLAQRLIYLEKQDALKNEEIFEIQKMIHKRFHPEPSKEHPWRSLDDALKELSEPRAMELGNAEQIAEIKNWLEHLSAAFDENDVLPEE